MKALSEMADEDIDFTDIPDSTEEQLRQFVHGPWTPRTARNVTLKIDDEVAQWLETAATSHSHLINLVLKREAQRAKRAAKSTSQEFTKAS